MRKPKKKPSRDTAYMRVLNRRSRANAQLDAALAHFLQVEREAMTRLSEPVTPQNCALLTTVVQLQALLDHV